MMKAFPQLTWDEYLYKRSVAQLQIMANDNTHVKYLKGKDKKLWETYQKRLEAQEKFESFLLMGRNKEDNNE